MKPRRLLKHYRNHRDLILRSSYVIVLALSVVEGGGGDGKKKTKKTSSAATPKLSWKKYLQFISDTICIDRKTPILLGSQVLLLIIRAVISLKIASLDGKLVANLVSSKFNKFLKLLVLWMVIGIPASFINSSLNFLQHYIKLIIRNNLTNKLINKYLPVSGDNTTIYKLMNSAQIHDPNQRVTTNIEQLSDSLAKIFPQLLKPSLDVLLCAYQLSKTAPNSNTAEGVLILGLVVHFTTILLKKFQPNFTRLSIQSNDLENNFHIYHSKVIENNEQLALSKSYNLELNVLDKAFFELALFKRLEFRRFAVYDTMMTFIVKYTWGAAGLLLCSLPIFVQSQFKEINDHLINEFTSSFITNRRLLLTGSDSLGKIIQSKKNLQNLRGYVMKTLEFEEELNEINASQTVVKSENITYNDTEEIIFDNVPLVTPSGQTLVQNLSFHIKKGDHLLIIGPNGAGKSSFFRILGGLWPVVPPGKLGIPNEDPVRKNFFYLPQKPYFTIGTLKEQIVYPDSVEGCEVTDEELYKLLELTKLEYLATDCEELLQHDIDTLTADHGKPDELRQLPMSPFDYVRNWSDLLSIGEQQRLALCRLYYQRPKFAILDECTSSISADLEQDCYKYAIEELGITVLSVCHRTTLWKFHSHLLQFKVKDNITTTSFHKFSPEERLLKHEELVLLDSKLAEKQELEQRLKFLEQSTKSRPRNRSILYISDDEDEEID
ncbi:Peroxisomal ATP-binding cassette transporter complex (Pxa1p-Pxa2p) subunit [Komagataella phaffii CBS 7435]|uniref:Subunit of a heterodimeric peroxisomal ATP-binding cassette transporter complex (Pxa1p-Pxa2p) n=2 Tax=Komagataella phaffii TaxID=460519 RepID=C4R2B7_KOMPG|nr:Subunit of a heterodimeric peroxisomal ATP-binding cassette transporter complex (Pxa1p-Pxa2p) [Komagataella phaffii GS115]AOA62824.1 GQ67_01061T0 [Komagataella phaffii]CAH2447807.1 Peroxisomal ATP-binding cassette transporter complex (Pxa1p-Pxa2p) subunit [Komagataella phaffii CBS 7435]AOA67518.1 GQ68_00328T0 [Komagataella phaffii GS115]CAY69641.1 Subunit of a heterodimeric peroxisomal ATP-binding cassette transporter complex (Pxa1p-Pxa2p) [Komagataella phaffii GS115]CCA37978.1 Peroxisomal 